MSKNLRGLQCVFCTVLIRSPLLTWVAKPGKLKNVHKTISRFFLWFSPSFPFSPVFYLPQISQGLLPPLPLQTVPPLRAPPGTIIRHLDRPPAAAHRAHTRMPGMLGWAGWAVSAGEIKQLDNGSVQWLVARVPTPPRWPHGN